MNVALEPLGSQLRDVIRESHLVGLLPRYLVLGFAGGKRALNIYPNRCLSEQNSI